MTTDAALANRQPMISAPDSGAPVLSDPVFGDPDFGKTGFSGMDAGSPGGLARGEMAPFGIFAVAGDALGFAVRRFETIARIAWLPVSLMLIVQMAAVFTLISIEFGRFVTFTDLVQGLRFADARTFAGTVLMKGLGAGDVRIILVAAVTAFFSLMLVASFMASLIRLAGKGIEPPAGLFRAPFGADEMRYTLATLAGGVLVPILILSPILLATLQVIAHVETAMAATFVRFPVSDSLHTIQYVQGRDLMTARGDLWVYEFGKLGLLSIGVGALAIVLAAGHFRRPGAGVRSNSATVLMTGLCVAALLFAALIPATNRFEAGFYSDVTALGLIAGAGFLIAIFAGLRLFPYPGIAVCNQSMSLAGVGRLSRRWNIVRLFAVIALIGTILWMMNFIMVKIGFPVIAQVFSVVIETSDAFGRLTQGAANAATSRFVIWLFALLEVLYQIVWSFFTYGVLAGLLGRFYRERAGAPRVTA